MKQRVGRLLQRLEEVEGELGKPDLVANQKRYRELTQEHSYLSDVQRCWDRLEKASKELEENRALLDEESDEELICMLREEIERLEKRISDLEAELQGLLVPPDPNDSRNTILEIRAGTGGDEAALFVADCIRMYRLFADRMGWRYEQLSSTPSTMGGFKEFVMVLSGKNVYKFLKREGGTHRVQRVPETEAQGRVHTSAVTIAVLLEPDEAEELKIDEKEIRIDTYRASGAGGQHVNVTDSAVRITHLPTGTVVACQDERSQRQNKEKAMRYLASKLAEIERLQKEAAIASTRAQQVGSGDRSERIRTYNFPQNRITDHRIQLTRYNLDQVMEGHLEEVVSELIAYDYREKLEGGDR